MRRNAVCLVVCSLIVVLSGCKIFKRKDKSEASLSAQDPYAYDATVEQPNYEPLDLPAYEPAAPVAAPRQANWAASPVAEAAPSGAARYHTVARKETLYSLARQYYGDQSKWKEIYESNRTTIADPNRIFVGQRLLIP